MFYAVEDHPVWDMIEEYEKHFGRKYMIGTMEASGDLTGDELLSLIEEALNTDTPIPLDHPDVYPEYPEGAII